MLDKRVVIFEDKHGCQLIARPHMFDSSLVVIETVRSVPTDDLGTNERLEPGSMEASILDLAKICGEVALLHRELKEAPQRLGRKTSMEVKKSG